MRFATIAVLLAVAGCGRSGALLEEGGWAIPPDLPNPRASPTPTASSSPTPMSVLCDPSDTDLLACFAFDASAADGSSFGVTPAIANLAFAPGVEGSALLLSAATGFVLPDANAYDPPDLTFEMWVAPSQLPAGRFGLIDKDGQLGIFLQADGSVTGSLAATPAGTFAAGEWHHLAYVLGPAAVEIYVDGVLADTAAGVLASIGGDGVHLGENGTAGDDQLLGRVDRFRVWRALRTATEVCTEAGTCPP